MTIASEITRIKTAIADAYTACQEMGATMPAVLNSNNLEQCIASITVTPLQHWYNWVGASLPTLTSTSINNLSSSPIIYSGNMFHSLHYNKHFYSSDGITWQSNDIASTNYEWCDIASNNNGIFVAISNSQNIWYSTDYGITWNNSGFGSGNGWKAVNYGNGIFLAIAENNNGAYTATSTDGINWSGVSLGSYTHFEGMRQTFIDGYFYSYWQNTGYRRTADGINWETLGRFGLSYLGHTLFYANGKYIDIAPSDAQNKASINISEDLSSWNTIQNDTIKYINWVDCKYVNGLYFLMPNTTNDSGKLKIAYSSDLINWQFLNNNDFTWHSWTYNNSFAVNDDGILVSSWDVVHTINVNQPSVYTLDQNPTTSSVVYDLPNTPSALTITGVETGTITLSDSNTYTYNAEGDIEQ